jgi:F-type H+-transporting ATPase subunit gamma
MRPYAEKLNDMLRNILANLDGDGGTTFGKVRPLKNAAIVVVTSNRGLAGAFNSNVVKSSLATLKGELADAQTVDVYCIGKKGNDYYRRNFADNPRVNLISDYVNLFGDLAFDNTKQVPERLMNRFADGSYDQVHVSYARFRNAAVQYATTEQFLPVMPPEEVEGAAKEKYKADYIFEPGQEELLDYLIPSILQTSFQKYLLDTHASEHGARMTAMDKATENAQEMLKELKISYNKARQEAITNEILEIVGGAAALEDN